MRWFILAFIFIGSVGWTNTTWAPGGANLSDVQTDILCHTDGGCDVGSASNSMGDGYFDGRIVSMSTDADNVVNVKAFGALGDGIERFDGAISSGTTTFSAAGASFTSADIGKVITIRDAGGALTDLTTTISGVTNSSTITLADSASATVSNTAFRYGTDDTTAIRSAIAYVYSTLKDATVFFPAGLYIVNGTFSQPNQSQIAIPTVTSSEQNISIKIKGATEPNLNARYSGGSVIFGTRYGTNGTYSVLSGGAEALTYVRLVIEDMTFKTVQDPTHSVVNLEWMHMASGDSIAIDDSIYPGATPALQTHNDSYGLITPRQSNGNIDSLWSAVKIKRVYNGIKLHEHMILDNSMIVHSARAIVLGQSQYPITIGYVSVEQCVDAIVAVEGATYLDARMVDIESWGTGNFIGGNTVTDASNYIKGRLTYNIIGISGGSALFVKTGAKYLSASSFNDNGVIRNVFKGNTADGTALQNSGTSGTTGGAALILRHDGDAAVGSGHRLGSVLFQGAYNTTNSQISGASMEAFSAQAFSSSSTGGTDIVFKNAPIGSGTRVETVTIKNSGFVGIGTTAPQALLEIGTASGKTSIDGTSDLIVKDDIEVDGGIYVDESIYLTTNTGGYLYVAQPDGGCSRCGVDAAGTTWACVDITCGPGM